MIYDKLRRSNIPRSVAGLEHRRRRAAARALS
jgi:hypothetical protein